MQERDVKQIDITDERYPTEWKTLPDAPKILQYLGDITLLQTRKFTVVGSRTTPAQARKLGGAIAGALSKSFTIVTGVADGGDEAAVEGTLAANGKPVCVLAGGFSALPQGNLPLLREVVKKGLLLSPYPFDEPTRNFSYEYRNKLIASLGEGTLVLGAAEKSGALITAKHAQKAGKPVFALPYAPNTHAGVGCNALIKRGGYLTESAADIFERMGVENTETAPSVPLTQEEERLLFALRELSQAHINELSLRASIPAFKARAILSSLEVKGLAVSLGGNRYSPV